MSVQINSGSWGFWRLELRQTNWMEPFNGECFSVKLNKCFVDYETSPDLRWSVPFFFFFLSINIELCDTLVDLMLFGGSDISSFSAVEIMVAGAKS